MNRRFDPFQVANYGLLALISLLALYPVYYVFINSVSDPVAVMQNKVLLVPQGLHFGAYKEVFDNGILIRSYGNTVFYTLAGTVLNLVLTTLGAFPLSRRNFWGRRGFMMMITFTMIFSGGLIPTYLVVQSLGLVNTPWALVVPGAVSAFNLIVMKSFFENIPGELEESVKLDGGSDWIVLTRLILPLSKPIFAVITLFYAVGHWNEYFNALIYLKDRTLYPIQLELRAILLFSQTKDMLGQVDMDTLKFSRVIQYATIMIVVLPMLVLYPLLQKYFVHGMLVGAIKE